MLRLSTLSALVLAWLPAVASAAPGDHIRAGDAELVPSIQVGGEYRTNLYRSEVEPVSGANLRVAPAATLSAGSEDHSFKLGGVWELRKFLFVAEHPQTATLSAGERASRFDRYNDFGVNANMALFRREVVGFTLSNATNLRNTTTDAQFSEAPFTSQFRNNLSGGIPIRPGAALSITPGAAWAYDQYLAPQRDGVDGRSLSNRHSYGPNLDAKWSFLPRTAVFFNASYRTNQWTDGPVLEAIPDASIGSPDSDVIRTLAGIDGRFTERIFLNLGVGYGVGLYDAGVNASGLDGLLLSAQARYQLVQGEGDEGGASWSLGYQKDFRDNFFTNYVAVNRVYTSLSGNVRDFRPSLRYEIRSEGYKGEQVTRTDLVNRIQADFGYAVSDWATITPGAYWQQRASSDDQVEYDDWNIHLLGTFVY